MTAPPRPIALDALTGLRGVAAWWVVIFHTRAALGGLLPAWLMRVADRGYLAVDLFFILSGFVLWHSGADRLAGGGWAAARHFWWRRLARIWPLHAVILSGCMALALVLAMAGRDASAYPWREWPLHLLLMQNWGFTPRLSWNDPAWSISCEMVAYGLFPALVAVVPRRPGCWGLIAAGAGLLGAIALYFGRVGGGSLTWDVPHTGLVRCLLEFTLGAVVRMGWGALREATRAGARAAAWGLCLGLGVFGLGLGWAEAAFVPGCLAALILALALDRGGMARVLGGRVLLALGQISYSTYLAHHLLFVLFKLAFVRAVPILSGGQLAAYLGLVLMASFALHRLVEQPSQRWLNARG